MISKNKIINSNFSDLHRVAVTVGVVAVLVPEVLQAGPPLKVLLQSGSGSRFVLQLLLRLRDVGILLADAADLHHHVVVVARLMFVRDVAPVRNLLLNDRFEEAVHRLQEEDRGLEPEAVRHF